MAIWPCLVVAFFLLGSSTWSVDGRRAMHSKHSTYQAELIERTAVFRPGAHTYAGYPGPWLEARFFAEWVKQGPQLQRICLPIAWTECLVKLLYFNNPNLQKDIQAFLEGLDPAFQYFSVAQLDRAFDHPEMTLQVPKGIDLWLFASGGSSKNLRVTPVPLLKQELIPKGVKKNNSCQLSREH